MFDSRVRIGLSARGLSHGAPDVAGCGERGSGWVKGRSESGAARADGSRTARRVHATWNSGGWRDGRRQRELTCTETVPSVWNLEGAFGQAPECRGNRTTRRVVQLIEDDLLRRREIQVDTGGRGAFRVVGTLRGALRKSLLARWSVRREQGGDSKSCSATSRRDWSAVANRPCRDRDALIVTR